MAFDSNTNVTPIPYVNPYSIVVPASLPGYKLFLSNLILDREAPIALGLEAWGLNKKKGSLQNKSQLAGDLLTKKVSVQDGSGQLVVSGQVNNHVKTGQASLEDSFYTWQPSFSLYDGNLKFGRKSKLANELNKIKFVPLLTIHAEKMQFTFDDPSK